MSVLTEVAIVIWLSTGLQTDSFVVPALNVLEIEITEPAATAPTKSLGAGSRQIHEDPAILSYERPDGSMSRGPKQAQADQAQEERSQEITTPIIVSLPAQLPSASVLSQPHPASKLAGDSDELLTKTLNAGPEDMSASATLTGPFNDMSLTGHEPQLSEPDVGAANDNQQLQSPPPEKANNNPRLRTRGKRAGKKMRGLREGMVSTPTQTASDLDFASNNRNTVKSRTNSSKKGWRQTPLLEEPALAKIHIPRAQGLSSPVPALKPKSVARQSKIIREPAKGRSRRQDEEDQNGWATGEATDIQDMGDFDFEENHKKFDKDKVFDQIRRDDTTADESRLVNFNKLPSARPGTLGGKNLHYTENVLSSPINKMVDHSSGDSETDLNEARISSGRSVSRASTKRIPPSRKGSALAKTSFDHIASPKIKTDSSTSHRAPSSTQKRPAFLISPFHRVCPCISPLQMLELEQLAITELGLTEDILTENAAMRIAQTAYGLTSPDSPRQAHAATIVILVGNNKTGSRAIAAGRHLRSHGSRVVICVLGLEREDDLLDSVRRQLRIFRSCGGEAIKQDALMKTLRKSREAADLIVDALLGIHISFDDLRSDDQAAYFQLVCWANGSKVDVLALDVPSGIDAATGTLHSVLRSSLGSSLLQRPSPTGLTFITNHHQEYQPTTTPPPSS